MKAFYMARRTLKNILENELFVTFTKFTCIYQVLLQMWAQFDDEFYKKLKMGLLHLPLSKHFAFFIVYL